MQKDSPETVAFNVALKFYGFGAPQDVLDDAVRLLLEYNRVVFGSSLEIPDAVIDQIEQAAMDRD